MKPLCELDLPWKLLVSMFLFVLTSGFVMSELYLKHTAELMDGKEGVATGVNAFVPGTNRALLVPGTDCALFLPGTNTAMPTALTRGARDWFWTHASSRASCSARA